MNDEPIFFRDLKQTRVLNVVDNLENAKTKNRAILKIKMDQKYIDNLLNGGFHQQLSYVIFGSYMSGKTQICHHLCIQAYKNSIKTVFLDTENTFRPERINELAELNHLDNKKVLRNILVSKILSNIALQLKLNELEQIIQKDHIQLMIIDSINNYYRLERGDKEIPSHVSRVIFHKILERINNLTQKFNLITIMAAQVSPNFTLETPIRENPVGLAYLNHFFSEFIYLSYKENSIGSIHYVNSKNFPEKKVQYKITKNGIEDYKI